MASPKQRPSGRKGAARGKEPPGEAAREEPYRRSLRLTFRYEGDQIELVRARRVAMTPPPSDSLGATDPRPGFCVEVCTQRGRVLYRRFDSSPIGRSVEAPSDDPERPFRRATVESPSGEFDVVVPDLDDAARLDVLDDPLPDPTATRAERAAAPAPGSRPAERIASVDLRDLPTTPRRKR